MRSSIYFPYRVRFSSNKCTKPVKLQLHWKPILSLPWSRDSTKSELLLLQSAPNLPGILHDLVALYRTGARVFTWLILVMSKIFLSNYKPPCKSQVSWSSATKSPRTLHKLWIAVPVGYRKTAIWDLNIKDNYMSISEIIYCISCVYT